MQISASPSPMPAPVPAPAAPAYPPIIKFVSAPVGSSHVYTDHIKIPMFPDQVWEGASVIQANDGYHFAATAELTTSHKGKVHVDASMTQIGPDLLRYDWKAKFHPFGARFGIPFTMSEVYKVVSSVDDRLEFVSVDRPNERPSHFSYVGGLEETKIFRNHGIVVTATGRAK